MQAALRKRHGRAADRFLDDLGRYLDKMAGCITGKQRTQPDDTLLETRFMGQGYSLSVQCRTRGLRRFVVNMYEPWPHTAVVGRLAANNEAHLYVCGALLFMDYLVHEGLDRAFLHDIEESLALCGLQASKSVQDN